MWFRQLREKYPRGMTIWLGPLRPTLIICHTDLCKTILRSTEPKQVSGLGGYTLLKPWLGIVKGAESDTTILWDYIQIEENRKNLLIYYGQN